MSSNKIILLKSSDGESFEMKESAARKLQIIAHMIEDDCFSTDEGIPLENVTRTILALVIEYCNEHIVDDVAADSTDEAAVDTTDEAAADSTDDTADVEVKKNLEAWDAEFIKKLDLETRFQLLLVANYLNVKSLLDLASQTIADHIKDLTVEEVRTIFNVEKDYTDEEEEAVRTEYAWAFL